MVDIPVIPYNVAAGAEVDVASVVAVNTSVGGISGRQLIHPPMRTFIFTVGPEHTPYVRSIHYTHRTEWPVAIRDWGDYIFEDERLVYTLGDSANVIAPLLRLIQPSPGTRYLYQRVLIPDENFTPIVLKVDGVPLTRDDWAFDDFGIADIPQELVPSGSILTWSGQALVPGCFLDDTLGVKINVKQTSVDEAGVQSIPQARVGEIFEEELNALMAKADDSV